MNDRFKFRAYNVVTREFVNNVSGISDYSDMENDDGKNFGFRAVNDNQRTLYTAQLKSDWILMQCSGLECKNGTLIYEGDIVKCYYTDPDTDSLEYDLMKVFFDTTACAFGLVGLKTDKPEYFAYMEFNPDEYEVCGNIYENPELSEGSDE